MADFKKMYYALFNVITDAIEEIELGNPDVAERLLKNAQYDTEEIFLKSESIALDNSISVKIKK